jgi:hypothetical protein
MVHDDLLDPSGWASLVRWVPETQIRDRHDPARLKYLS